MNLTKEMIQVYEEYAQLSDDSEVMALVNNTPIERKVEAFNLYKDYLQGKSRFLDWGCKDGHVGYMVNSLLPEKVEIHGCDIRKGKYSIFSEKANLEYSQLKHHYKLPYEDNYFDVVIGNGVLEHVANDSESIKELYRIIKPDGYLVITFLPNFWSYTEFISRMIKHGGHRRIYSLKEIKKMLLHKGFISVNSGYHQVVPSLVSLSKIKQVRFLYPILNQIYKVNKYLDKLPLINKIAANIYVICQKKSAL
jgi:2-polyprenyl-3-methyl-5-hydroxy-6-metoxy-1,4-benzoquinol methylase